MVRWSQTLGDLQSEKPAIWTSYDSDDGCVEWVMIRDVECVKRLVWTFDADGL